MERFLLAKEDDTSVGEDRKFGNEVGGEVSDLFSLLSVEVVTDGI